MEAVKINLGKVSISVEKDYWDIDKQYDRLTIVERQSTHTCFLSRKPVPAGISIANREYWIQFSTWQDIPYEIVQEFGNNSELAVSQKVLTQKFAEVEQEIANILNGTSDIIDKNIHLSQAQINQILLADAITATLSASPSPIFVGVEQVISLVANVSTIANEIKIKKGETIIATGSGTSLSDNDTITPSEAGSTNYSAEFTIGGLTKIASKSVTAVYPIRVGSSASYTDGTPLTTPKTSPAGTYNVTVVANANYIWFNVPATMSINRATMSGFDFPLENSTSVTINGIAYKSYRSSNTYDVGTYQIVIS